MSAPCHSPVLDVNSMLLSVTFLVLYCDLTTGAYHSCDAAKR